MRVIAGSCSPHEGRHHVLSVETKCGEAVEVAVELIDVLLGHRGHDVTKWNKHFVVVGRGDVDVVLIHDRPEGIDHVLATVGLVGKPDCERGGDQHHPAEKNRPHQFVSHGTHSFREANHRNSQLPF